MAPPKASRERSETYWLDDDPMLSKVYHAMNEIAPLSMAETSWDNVGVQIQAPLPARNEGRGVFLCEDLTYNVALEAMMREDIAVIVTYHPIIFRPLKSLTLQNYQQRSLLQLMGDNISVYAAHTSLDVARGGINDWLARMALDDKKGDSNLLRHLDNMPPIVPHGNLARQNSDGQSNPGQGRWIDLDSHGLRRLTTRDIIQNLKANLGLDRLIVSLPRGIDDTDEVNKIAVAAGSGASIVSKMEFADVYITGEMSHHDVLAAMERRIIVIQTLHDNSERGYLKDVLQERLTRELGAEDGMFVVLSKEDKSPSRIV